MKRLAFILIFAISAPSAFAQTPRNTAEQILRAHTSTGTLPQDIIIIGQQTDWRGRVELVRIWIKGKNQVRYEIGSGSGLTTTVYTSGSSAWTESGSRTTRLQAHTAIQRPGLIPFLDLIADIDKPEMEFADLGVVPLGQTTARRMAMRLRDSMASQREFRRALDEVLDVYFDPGTSLILRTEHERRADNNSETRVPTSFEFGDYRNVQGLIIPFRVVCTIRIPGLAPRQTTYVWQSVNVNQGVSDSLFISR